MPFAQDFLRPYARLATTNRLMLYGAFSTLAVSLVIMNAFKSYSNFYSVAVYLSRSNRSVMVLANFGVLGALLIGRGFQHVFFGPLRPTEVERLYDKIWFFLTESLLAFTIFRDEFDISFAVMFGFLLFVKCFHWLMSFRIEWMDQIQYPGPNLWFHVRMNILFLFLWIIDTIMLCFAIESIMTHGIGGVVLFASEYAILMASALNSMSKYFIIFYDIRRAGNRGGENAPVWEDKSMYIFYVELATDFLKLVTYLTFFLVVLTFYGLPLNILRDIYMTARSFFQRCRDLIRYRTATRNMDERYPNATEEELGQMTDRTCIICREEMIYRNPNPIVQPAPDQAQSGINDTPKKLPCGHVFHFHCLRSWLERQQSCPTCRRTVLETRPLRQNAGTEGQPPVPQPGAVPQAQGFGNIGGVGGPQQPQGPGIIARWLGGAAGAPPIVPGQFAPGPEGFNALPPNPFQHPQQPFPPAQNPFQHPQQPFPPAQNPFGPWVPMQQQGPPPPVQVLQGFYIGNHWQPWGAPPPQQQQQQPRVSPQGHATDTRMPTPTRAVSPSQNPPPPQHPVAQNARQTQPVATAAQPQAATPPIQSNSQIQRGTSSQASPDETSSATSSTPPREAAALAALHRSNSVGSTSSGTATSPPSTESSEIRPRANNALNRSNIPSLIPLPPTPITQPPHTQSMSPTARAPTSLPQNTPVTTARPTAQTPMAARPQRAAVPSLIPLFDPASTSATIVPPPNQRPNQPQYPGYSQGFRPRPRPVDHPPPNTGLPDLRSLPQILTQEQLDRLDVVTREALDERIRILESLQGVMWRCAEELVRMRSVLPPPPPLPPPSRQNVPASQQQAPATASSAMGTTAPYNVGTDAAIGSEGGSASSTTLPPEEVTGSSSGSQPIVPTAVSVEVPESGGSSSGTPDTVIQPAE